VSFDWQKIKATQEVHSHLQMLGVFKCADYLRGGVSLLWLYSDLLPQMRPKYIRNLVRDLQDVRADEEAS
jgi:hypothetical protein